MASDSAYEQNYREMKERMAKEIREVVGGESGPNWWEDDVTMKGHMKHDPGIKKEKFGILWPADKRKVRERKLKKMGHRELVRT